MTRMRDDRQFELASDGDDMFVQVTDEETDVLRVPFPGDDGPDTPEWLFLDRAVAAANAAVGVPTQKLTPGLVERLVALVGRMDAHFTITGAPDDDELVREVAEIAEAFGVAAQPAASARP